MINDILIKRWVILQHTISRDSIEGLHFDLLLEDQCSCRTWRLPSIPQVGGPLIEAIPQPPHNLYWLDREESLVSGGRGWAKRVLHGKFYGSLPSNIDEFIFIQLSSNSLNGQLVLGNRSCRITVSL